MHTSIRPPQSRRQRRSFRGVSFVAGAALLIVVCSTVPILSAPLESVPSAGATPPPARIAGASALKPIDRAALQTTVDTAARELLIPGAVVLLRTPQGEFAITFGTTQLGTTTPPRADTHFRIASNTKTMTAAVILQLAQEDKLSLGDHVSKYVPGVPNGDTITIAQLLEMRSGLYNCTDAPAVSAQLDRDPTKIWTTDEVLAIAFKQPPNDPPDTKFEYNNTNYALLGLIAEKVDGKPLARSMQDRLFGPLGMKNTVLPAQHFEQHPRTVLARLLVWQLFRCLGGHTAVLTRIPSFCQGRENPSQRLHGPEPFLCLRSRGRHLERQRPCHLDSLPGHRPRV